MGPSETVTSSVAPSVTTIELRQVIVRLRPGGGIGMPHVAVEEDTGVSVNSPSMACSETSQSGTEPL